MPNPEVQNNAGHVSDGPAPTATASEAAPQLRTSRRLTPLEVTEQLQATADTLEGLFDPDSEDAQLIRAKQDYLEAIFPDVNDRYAASVLWMEREELALRAAAHHLTARARRWAAAAEHRRNTLAWILNQGRVPNQPATETISLPARAHSITLIAAPRTVRITCEALLPDEYMRTIPGYVIPEQVVPAQRVPDLDRIETDLLRNITITGAELAESRPPHVRISS